MSKMMSLPQWQIDCIAEAIEGAIEEGEGGYVLSTLTLEMLGEALEYIRSNDED